MIIQRLEDTILLKNETVLSLRRVGFDGYNFQTSYPKGVSYFTIPEKEEEVYAIFDRLMQDIIVRYMNTNSCNMGLSWNEIVIESDGTIRNQMTITKDPNNGDITLRFDKDPQSIYTTNRVILDIDGNLRGGYTADFVKFYEALLHAPSKDPSVLGRIRTFFKKLT